MDKKGAVSIGATIMVLAVAVLALGQVKPTNSASTGNYVLTADGEGAYFPPAEQLPAVIPTPPAPTVTGTATPVPAQKSTAAISPAPSPAELHFEHDAYCNYYAQAVTGNVTPEQAARRQQEGGAIIGAIGGALIGAMFGASGEHPGRSAMLGAGTGLAVGMAMGSGNARQAADDLSKRYADAYSNCMNRKDAAGAVQPGS